MIAKPLTLAVSATLLSMSLQAETTLRAGTFLQQSGVWHEPFAEFVDQINEEGKGLLQIEIVADPSAMNPFQMGEALSNGVLDFLNVSGAFYTNLVPESDALKLFNVPVAELRENGAFDLLNEIHREKMNAHFLSRWGEGITYHIYTNQALDGPSLEGFDMRGTPLYRPYLEALGANLIQLAPAELFSAMEAGIVDGYAWPLWGIGDLGLLEETDYRVEPGFYSAEIAMLVNGNTWDSLSGEQQDFLTEQTIKFEQRFGAIRDNITEQEIAKQDAAGIEVQTFTPEQNRRLVELANEQGWETVIRNSPEYGPRLEELTFRPNQ